MRANYRRTTEDYTEALRLAAAGVGFEPLADAEMAEFRAFASRLMDCEVAPAESFERALRVQPAAVLVRRNLGRICGLAATLLLRAPAEAKLLRGTFNGRRPDDDLAGPGDAPALYYVWGVAGERRVDRWAAMELCQRLRFEAFSDLTAFMKPATDDGRRAGVERLGFRPAGPSTDGFYVSSPIIGASIALEQVA
jgi:hypothetical protein